jgi:hypothetical protein
MWGGSDSFGLGDGGSDYSNEGIHYSDPSYAVSNSPVNVSPAINWADSWLARQIRSMVLSKALGPAAPVANMALSTAMSKNPGQTAVNSFGATLGGIMGGMIGGVPGAMAGSYAGGKFGNGFSGGDAGAVGSSKGGGFGELASGLYGLYRGSQASKGADTLSGLYGQNSPYAQQLRQSLERRDAASGRRSQYGPREVELQAKLADMYSRNYPMMAQAQDRRDQMYGQGLGLLFRGADRLGYIDKAKDWIGNQFSEGWNPQAQSSATLQSLYGNEGYGGLTNYDFSNWGTDNGSFAGGDVW